MNYNYMHCVACGVGNEPTIDADGLCADCQHAADDELETPPKFTSTAAADAWMEERT